MTNYQAFMIAIMKAVSEISIFSMKCIQLIASECFEKWIDY